MQAKQWNSKLNASISQDKTTKKPILRNIINGIKLERNKR